MLAMLNETFSLIFNHRVVQFKSRLKNAYFLSHSVSQIDPVSKWNQQSGERSFPRTTKVITYHNGFSQPGKWVSKVFKNPVKSVSKTNIKALFSTWTTIFKKRIHFWTKILLPENAHIGILCFLTKNAHICWALETWD